MPCQTDIDKLCVTVKLQYVYLCNVHGSSPSLTWFGLTLLPVCIQKENHTITHTAHTHTHPVQVHVHTLTQMHTYPAGHQIQLSDFSKQRDSSKITHGVNLTHKDTHIKTNICLHAHTQKPSPGRSTSSFKETEGYL